MGEWEIHGVKTLIFDKKKYYGRNVGHTNIEISFPMDRLEDPLNKLTGVQLPHKMTILVGTCETYRSSY